MEFGIVVVQEKNTIILQVVVLLICSILFFGKVEAINVKPYVDLVQG